MSDRRQRRGADWPNVPGRSQNLRGPNRALSVDEQLEVQRLMREAHAEHRRTRTAANLARRYGISIRTVYRYANTLPTPVGFESLTLRLRAWASERAIDLTLDDVASLVLVVSRHRDYLIERVAA